MTVGPDQQFQNYIIHLPEGSARTSHGVEMVEVSRAMNTYCIAFGNISTSLTELDILNNGTSIVYNICR